MANSCSSYTSLDQDHNLALHVGAVFVILLISGTACAFPLLVFRIPRLRIPNIFLFFVRHFGTGVLLATAFVHLLPTAFVSLTDPCLPPFWNERYPAMAGAIAMAGVFAIVVVEMVFSPGRSMCAFPTETSFQDVEASECARTGVVQRSAGQNRDFVCNHDSCDVAQSVQGERENSTAAYDNPTQNHLQQPTRLLKQTHYLEDRPSPPSSTYPPSLTSSQKFQRETLQCVLLEIGILFHSVFIGMALSVAIGNDFVVLLIAISFHQTFEGLALGSRIAAVGFPKSSRQPWLMAVAYGCTTPIGQAIGLALHSVYDPASATGLIMVGVMNAISSGLLTYASLVELMAEDFLSDHSWRVLRGKRRVEACVLVFAGAFCMALVGAWA